MSIETMFPSQNKVELFARQNVLGWNAWGNEIENPIVINNITSPARDNTNGDR